MVSDEQNLPDMNKIILPIFGATLASAACAQTVTVDGPPANDTLTTTVDTTAYRPDSTQSIAFTRSQIDDIERASSEAARAREERAAARAASSAAGSGATTTKSSSKSVKRSGSGRQLSLAQATDAEGRKHWKRMSKRSVRKDPDSPPGTTPAY